MLENWKIVKQNKQNKLSNIYLSKEISDDEIQIMMKKIKLRTIKSKVKS